MLIVPRYSGSEECRLAHMRYTKIRAALYETALPRIQELLRRRQSLADPALVRLTPINAEALNAWYGDWPESPHPDANFPWPELAAKFRKCPRRFEVAVWHGDTLCGLCLGIPSRGMGSLTIRWLEGRPYAHPLRGYVALVALSLADQFADYLGNTWVRLKNPNSGAIPKYESLGFRAVKPIEGARYHAREVDPDADRPDP